MLASVCEPQQQFSASISFHLQRERYDLIIPKAHYETLQGLKTLLDTIVSGHSGDELEALGGYDTRETRQVVRLRELRSPP